MNFKLNIKEPCHENWANMTPNEKGRFCDHCSKTVHDFTNHAPEEIAEVLKNGNGNVCGRVPNQYLNQSFAVQAGYGKWGAIALAGAATFSQIETPVESFDENRDKNHIQVNVQNNYYKFSGTVKDAEGKPVGGAAVQIMDGEKFVAQGYSLSNGNFALYVDKTKTTKNPLTVRIQKEGFVQMEETVITSQTPEWNHTFAMNKELSGESLSNEIMQCRTHMLGGVGYNMYNVERYENITYREMVTGGAVAVTMELNEVIPVEVAKEDSLVTEQHTIEEKNNENNYKAPDPKKIVVVFENPNKLNVYPNPTSEQITISLDRDKSYNAMIYDLSGKLLQQQAFTGNKLQMSVTQLVPGNYIVYVLDIETQKSLTQKIVVVR